MFQSAHIPLDLVYGHQWCRECLRPTRILIKQVAMHGLHEKLAIDLKTPVRRIGLSLPQPLSRESLLGWCSEREVCEKLAVDRAVQTGVVGVTFVYLSGRQRSPSSSLNFLEDVFPDGLDDVSTMPDS
jgi:hypothetical protein